MSGNEYGGKFLLLSLTLNNYKSITNVIIIVKENINNETNLAKTQHESFVVVDQLSKKLCCNLSQQTFTCSKLTTETLEENLKYVQS